MVRYQSDVEDTKESRYEDASHSRLAEHEQVWYPGTDAMESPRYERYIHAASSGAAPGAAAGTGAAGQSTNTSGTALTQSYEAGRFFPGQNGFEQSNPRTWHSSVTHASMSAYYSQTQTTSAGAGSAAASHTQTGQATVGADSTTGVQASGSHAGWHAMIDRQDAANGPGGALREISEIEENKDPAQIADFKKRGIYQVEEDNKNWWW